MKYFASRSLLLLPLLLLSLSAGAQDFKGRQKKQEHGINAAYHRNAITEKEYQKLLHEQDIIKDAIHEAESDGYWTAKEKNAVHEKLERAARRLNRYKTNNEVY